MKAIQIFSPDGQNRFVPLDADRISLGRSSAAELSFPDDNGLSRQHLAIERDGDGWALRDLGSKNGTMLNGVKVTGRVALHPGDRIAAGHLVLIYESSSAQATKPVVVFDHQAEAENYGTSSTVITHLDGVIKSDGGVVDPQLLAASRIYPGAGARGKRKLSGKQPAAARTFPFYSRSRHPGGAGGPGRSDDGGRRRPRWCRRIKAKDSISSTGRARYRAVEQRAFRAGARDTSIDDAFRERRSIVEQHIRTLMAVPLQTRDKIIGIIYVDSPSLLREFSKDDLNLLTVMANVAAIRIETTRFAEVEQARQLMARDLEQAAEIQQGILPSVAPVVRGLDVAGHNAPCRTVGGDYYDFFPYGSSRIAMVLGDVSGKGMPASLLMMGLQARVQVLIEEPKSLAEVMTRLNRITSANCPPNRFISLFFCILDGDTGEITFCNAGHNPPVIVRANGSYEQLKGGGPVLGILPTIEYEEYQAKLEEGDGLIIYSDGVTEATNPAGDEFEIEVSPWQSACYRGSLAGGKRCYTPD